MSAEVWASGEDYEPYVGRWSRLVAAEFLAWLGPAPGTWWLDVGCGTGALTEAVLTATAPAAVTGVDRSAGYVGYARRRLSASGPRPAPAGGLVVGDASALPLRDGSVDRVVSGLMLNFVPSPAAALAEMARVCRPGGVVAVYLWDYAGGMQAIRAFWDAAVALDSAAAQLDESRRFPLCRPDRLAAALAGAGLSDVDSTGLTVVTRFRDFADYWTPFLGRQGPAPTYCARLPQDARRRLRDRLEAALPRAADGSIPLTARAWAARGTVPG